VTSTGPTVTMLGGGIGCSRVAGPMAAALGPDHLTLVVNTADDMWRYGLRICPDLDTNLYALAGCLDAERGWGVAGDTFHTMSRLRQLGDDAWFNLGDIDLATHALRTQLLLDGCRLGAVTAVLCSRLGVRVRLLPMTDSEVETQVTIPAGTYRFQEWFVKLSATGPVEQVSYGGIETAATGPGVLEAIADADLVVLAPSNPVSSIEPILALPGVRDGVAARRSSVVAVTPMVARVPVDGESDAHRARARTELMRARGLPHSPTAVAALYRELAATLVLDVADRDEAPAIEADGHRVVVAETIVSNAERGARLAATLLDGCA
jgi:LPPG:FO 2-phospho-L-lactate transferase